MTLSSIFLKCFNLINDWKDAIQTSASIVGALGLFMAWYQIKAAKDIQKTQFEDSLAKEYRDLIQKIPLGALLKKNLSDKECNEAKPLLFHYINLTNDQIFLRSKGRVSLEVWNDWQGGIKYNLSLPAFKKFWEEISPVIGSFNELRKLEQENFNSDPEKWNKEVMK